MNETIEYYDESLLEAGTESVESVPAFVFEEDSELLEENESIELKEIVSQAEQSVVEKKSQVSENECNWYGVLVLVVVLVVIITLIIKKFGGKRNGR